MWDRRGHSRSEDGDGPGSCREDATDLGALIEHLGEGPVHLVGNSAGGNVVLNLVTLRPDLVRTAAVHEPGPFGLIQESDDPHLVQLVRDDKRLTGHVQRLIEGGEPLRAAEYFVEHIAVGPGAWEQFPDELKRIMESNAGTVADDVRDGWDVESVDINALASNPISLLISSGTESPELETAAAVELARLLPGARLETVEGAGHIPHRTHPDDYAAMLIEFIEGAARVSNSSVSIEGGVR